MTTNKLSKTQFTVTFVKPLERKFKFKTHWSGKESKQAGLKSVTGNYLGWSYTGKKDAPIVLKFSGNQLKTLSALLHEYAHSFLHRVGTEGHKLTSSAKEIEAETVARSVLIKLGVQLQEDTYIKKYQVKFKKKNGYEYKMEGRKTQINKLIDEMTTTLEPYKNIAQNLVVLDKKKKQALSNIKYLVVCSCCGQVWTRSRKTALIKEKGKGYYCIACGLKKSKNKLVIKDVVKNEIISAEQPTKQLIEKIAKQGYSC